MAASRVFERIQEVLSDDVIIALIELSIAGLDAFVTYGIYKTWKSAEVILRLLRGTPSIPVGNLLVKAVEETESGILQYAAIRGKVQATEGQIPPSRNGVSSVFRLTEHLEMRSKYCWNGSRFYFIGRTYEAKEFHPFCLGPISDCPISINFQSSSSSSSATETSRNTSNTNGFGSSPLLLMIKDLTVPDTSDLLQTFPSYFEKSERKESGFSNFFDYIFGFTTISGVQKTEKLLPVNEVITALGRVTKTGEGKYTLTAPSVPNAMYKLTPKPLEEIIEDYSVRTVVGGLLIILLTCGGALLVFDAVKRLKNAVYSRDNLPNCDNEDVDNANISSSVPLEGQSCVVCQTRVRDVIATACGHISTCQICSRRLDGRCPICRQSVGNIIRFYVS